MLVHFAVGLGEAPFDLLVMPLATGHLQCFRHMIRLQYALLAAAAADQLHSQLLGQCPGWCVPAVIQRAVVTQGNQCLVRQGGQKLDLKQLAAEHGISLAGFEQRHH